MSEPTHTETVTWRPIETAPKDRIILLWWEWPVGGAVRGEAERGEWMEMRFADSGYWWSGPKWARHDPPTHWAELLRGPGEQESER